MSDYIGGSLALLVIVAAIVGILHFSGNRGPGEGSIIPEAVAATPAGADYGWKVAAPRYDEGGEVAEYY
ncbi:MAG TPA: hypothetical protein VFK84_16345 [Burkholderiales bacterium]|nr:hypothetical protein [Burkholderiales bacterium]